MSNELATVSTKKPPLVAGVRNVAAIIPQDFEQAYRLSQAIAAAGWAPKSYLVDPQNPGKGYDVNKIAVGILHGLEVGLTPMAALQSIAVINGTPNLWGDGALAVVRASGLLKGIEEWEEQTAEGLTAHCRVLRASEANHITCTFSEADAKKAGLAGKSGPWTNYPKRMRKMRARLFCLRDAFADVLRGMRMAEETLDGGDLIQNSEGDYVPATPRPTRATITAQAEVTPHDATTGEIIEPELTAPEALALIASAPSVPALMDLWHALPEAMTENDEVFAAYEAKRESLPEGAML